MNKTIYNLTPTDHHVSFYGKAIVRNFEGGTVVLYSYNTKVASIDADGNFHRHWGGYSATTMRHVNSFCNTYGKDGYNKKEWEGLIVE